MRDMRGVLRGSLMKLSAFPTWKKKRDRSDCLHLLYALCFSIYLNYLTNVEYLRVELSDENIDALIAYGNKNGREICRGPFVRQPNWASTCTCSASMRGNMLASSGSKSENIICFCVRRGVSAKYVYKLGWVQARTSPGALRAIRYRLLTCSGRRRLTRQELLRVLRPCSAAFADSRPRGPRARGFSRE